MMDDQSFYAEDFPEVPDMLYPEETVELVRDVVQDVLDERLTSSPVMLSLQSLDDIITAMVDVNVAGAGSDDIDSADIGALISGVKSSVDDFRTSMLTSESFHNFMTTNFSDYTVVEGLLLILVLYLVVVKPCVRMLGGAFSWLM